MKELEATKVAEEVKENEEVKKMSKFTDEDIEKIVSENNETSYDDDIIRTHIYKNKQENNYMKVDRHSEGQPFTVSRFECGKWEYGLNGLKPIPYKLPELIEAVKRGETVFITNGEKNSDTLIELGFNATTAPFNYKNKWKYEFNDYIKGAREVVILKDSSVESEEFAIQCKKTIKYTTKNLTTLDVTQIAEILELQTNDKTDITEIRNELQNDEELKELLSYIVKKIEEGKK